jgi:hypothetical protein
MNAKKVKAPAAAQASEFDPLNRVAQLAIGQLRAELNLLETVINECSEMQTVLRAGNADFESKMSEVRQRLDHTAEPVLKRRQGFLQQIGEVATLLGNNANLSSLIASVNSPMRDEIAALRREVLNKLNLIRSITWGNQAVLIYTMDFYQRMMAGFSSIGQPSGAQSRSVTQNPSNCYNAVGKVKHEWAGCLIKRNC